MFPNIHFISLVILQTVSISTFSQNIVLNKLKIFHSFDIFICKNISTSETLPETQFSITFNEIDNCCLNIIRSVDGKIFENFFVAFWFANGEESIPDVLEKIKLCQKQINISKTTTFYHLTKQPLYHFLLANANSSLISSLNASYFRNEYRSKVEEVFICGYDIESNKFISIGQTCIEIYQQKSKEILQFANFDTTITELSLRRLNYFREVTPAILWATEGSSYFKKLFKPQTNPNDSLEFTEVSSTHQELETYLFLKDTLNFTKKGNFDNESLTRNDKDDSLENVGFPKRLNSGEADISIRQYQFIPYRSKGKFGLRYLHAPVASENAIIIFRQPDIRGFGYYFRYAFRPSVWKLIFSITLLISATASIIVSYVDESTPRNSTAFEKKFYHLLKILWTSIEIILKLPINFDGTSENPSPEKYGNFFVLMSLSVSCTFHTLYVSSLSSMFTIRQDSIKHYSQITDYGYLIVLNSDTPLLKPMLLSELNLKHILEAKVGKIFHQLFNSKTALATTSYEYRDQIRDNYEEDFLCESLSFLKLRKVPVRFAQLVRQTSPHRDHFNIKILHMYQSGVYRRTQIRVGKRVHVNCVLDKEHRFIPVSLGTVVFPLGLLAFGISTSIGLILIEIRVTNILL